LFVIIEEGAGYPDGSTVDSEGCVWTGLFGGWAARRYSPSGRLLDSVSFPVANVGQAGLWRRGPEDGLCHHGPQRPGCQMHWQRSHSPEDYSDSR